MPEEGAAQTLWGCHGSGALVKGAPPERCPVCGALAAEFASFGPFYMATPEHLGQLAPPALLAILAAVPGEVAASAPADEATLRRKPATGDWCAKEIVGHLLETDRLFQRLVGTILADTGTPPLESTASPWQLHEGKGYEGLPTPVLLDRLRQTREACLALIGDLAAEQWARRGVRRGLTVSLLDLGTWLVNHDRGHLAQLRQLCPT